MEPLNFFYVEFAAVNDLGDRGVYDATHEIYRVLAGLGSTYREGTVNRFGCLYNTDTRSVLRRERNSGERLRLTASYQLDSGKVGRYSLSTPVSRDNTGNLSQVGFHVAHGAPFNAQPQNATNQFRTGSYTTNPVDSSQFSAPDFRRVPETFSIVSDQGGAARTFIAAWASSELNDQWRHTNARLVALHGWQEP